MSFFCCVGIWKNLDLPVNPSMTSLQCCVLFFTIILQNWDFAIVLWPADLHLIAICFETFFIQVHIRVASPPIRFPCYMGINIPTKEELIANRPEFHDLANYIGKHYSFFSFFLFFFNVFSCRYFIIYIKIKHNKHIKATVATLTKKIVRLIH